MARLSSLLTWFLIVETGRLLLTPTPHIEPPKIAGQWDISKGSKDGGRGACEDAKKLAVALGYKAECQELM